ncbi:histidine phosphatase family protein [Acinetobacter puyangensis]|uniref:histidine phosphatase family protein n=1 Tax=Acinetobacter puyangensis TaxID=1096779 RepID=UPI003A4E0A79
MIELDLLRHGETELTQWQTSILRGQLDDALTDAGWQQMQQTFDQAFLNTAWQILVSSPLQRCARFAQTQAQQHDLPVLLLDNLKEMNFGDWEGLSTADLYQHFPDDLARFWQTPTQFSPPNAEKIQDFALRIQTALQDIYCLAQQYQYKKVCVITHGGVIKLCYCLAQQRSLDDILTLPASLATLHHFRLDFQAQQFVLTCH